MDALSMILESYVAVGRALRARRMDDGRWETQVLVVIECTVN